MTTPAEQAVIEAANRISHRAQSAGSSDAFLVSTELLGALEDALEALREERMDAAQALDAEPAPKPTPRNYLVSYTCLTGPGLLTHGRTFGAGPADGGPATEKTVRSWEYSILQASTEPGATRTYGVAIHSFTELGQ